MSNILRAHPGVLSLSEFFFSVGGKAALHAGQVSAREFWQILSTPRAEITFMLQHGLWIPEFLYVPRSSHDPRLKDGIPPLLLTTLPHLVDHPEEVYRRTERFVHSLPNDLLSSQYLALFDWLKDLLGKAVWVERSGASLTHLVELMSLWPDAKFVHLFRDGRECALSMSQHKGFRLFMNIWLTGRQPSLTTASHIPLDRFGVFWSWMIIQRARLLRKLPPDRVLQLRYEDLTADPVKEIRRLLTFVLPGFNDSLWLEAVAPTVKPQPIQWPGLSDHEIAGLQRACMPGLRALGYLRHPAIA